VLYWAWTSVSGAERAEDQVQDVVRGGPGRGYDLASRIGLRLPGRVRGRISPIGADAIAGRFTQRLESTWQNCAGSWHPLHNLRKFDVCLWGDRSFGIVRHRFEEEPGLEHSLVVLEGDCARGRSTVLAGYSSREGDGLS